MSSMPAKKLRALAGLTTAGLASVALLGFGAGHAAAATGSQIVSIANANLGKHYCDTNSAGGTGFDNSCTNGGEFWCGDFVAWVWQQAGITVPAANPAYVPSWTQAPGYHAIGSGYTPQPGDAVVFADDQYSNGSHIALVTDYSNGLLSDIGGDEGGGGTPWWSTSSVQVDEGNGAAWNPSNKLFAGQSYEMWVIGYVSSGASAGPAVPSIAPQGTINSGTFNLLASDTDSTTTSVTFKVDGTVLGTATNGPNFSLPWNTTTVSNGTHQITAYATNTQGSSPVSAPVSFTTSNVPPAPTAQAPSTPTGLLSAVATLTASAPAATSVTYYVDGTATGSSSSAPNFPFDWDTTKVSNGSHSVTAVATNSAGSSPSSGAVSVQVMNTSTRSGNTVIYPSGLAATFKIGADHNLYNAWQTLPSRTFTSANLGAGQTGGLVGNPAAILNSNGLTSVFARTTAGTIASVYQTAAQGAMNNWANNIALGGPTFASDPAPVLYPNGAFGVFAVGTDGNLWTTYQPSAAGTFVGWINLGNGGTGGLVGTPAAILNASGLASAYVRTAAGQIVQVYQPSAGAAMNQWATPLASGAPTFVGDPAAVLYQNGAFGVLAVGTDGNLWTTYQTGAASGWVGWINLGQGSTGGLVGTPSATVDSNNLTAVFVRTSSGTIAALSQDPTTRNITFSASSIGTSSPVFAGNPSAVLYPSGYYAAFAVDTNGNEQTSWQSDPTRLFSNWIPVQ